MKYTPESMDQELQAAKRNTRDRLTVYRELLAGYAGPSFRNGERTYMPENHAYEWVTNTLMQVVNDNPRCMVKSKRGGEYQLHAEGMRNALDQWCADNDLAHFLRTGPALNMSFARGIAYVDLVDHESGLKYEAQEGEEPLDEPVMPKVRNISPEDFVFDPVHDDPREWMYCGHRTVWDKDALLERADREEGWDRKVLEEAVASIATSGKPDEQRKRDGIDRDEIVIWELWCPNLETEVEGDEENDDKYHGSIVTLIDYSYQDATATKVFPRKVRAAFVPREGPYALFDALKVPEDGWPVAPLVATKGQADELNAESRAVTAGMDSWKRLLFTQDKKLAEKIKNNPTDTVHFLPDVDKAKLLTLEVGGLSAEQLTAFQFRRERLDRNSGLTEAARGQSSTGATATADVIANAGAQVRMALFKVGVERGTRELLKRVLWYVFQENQIAIFLGEVQTPEGAASVWARGGPASQEDSFDAYEFSIEPYSMERTSEAQMQRQAAFLIGPFLQAAQVMPMTPHIPWGDWASAMADLLNMPSIKKLVNVQVLSQLQALTLQNALQPQPTTGMTGQPSSPRVEPKVSGGGPGKGAPQMPKPPTTQAGPAQVPKPAGPGGPA